MGLLGYAYAGFVADDCAWAVVPAVIARTNAAALQATMR